MNDLELPRIDRRTAIKWIVTASASLAIAPHWSMAADAGTAIDYGAGYGTDPDLIKSYNPGDIWPLTLTSAQRQTVAALCDVIIPADAKSPSASAVGVHDFIDEWISAPYPGNVADRKVILDGLVWLEAESQKRFGLRFVNAIGRQKSAICDDICFEEKSATAFKEPSRFFARFRNLTAGGFYTTPEGMKDIGYIGNVPLDKFEGPPADLIKKLGLA
ncbi:MAG TPA: gluconate 2-dehydrogenase subunit 3 family protein [Opitutus sp.]|nr:gluconate 2-dehydrogenase subunit 3 family protein [Opitutus sp.]